MVHLSQFNVWLCGWSHFAACMFAWRLTFLKKLVASLTKSPFGTSQHMYK